MTGRLATLALLGVMVVSSLALAEEATNVATAVTGKFTTGLTDVDQVIEKQESDANKLLIIVTKSAPEDGKYVTYIKMVWGDLDDKVKRLGARWDGKLELGSATGKVVKYYHWNGNDKMLVDSGSTIEWNSLVAACYDGLLVKVVSDAPNPAFKVTASGIVHESGATTVEAVKVTPPAPEPVKVEPVEEEPLAPPAPPKKTTGFVNPD